MIAAIAAITLMLALALGAGCLICCRLDERASWLEWLQTRVVLGLAALPIAAITSFELLRVPIRPWMALVLGGVGLVVGVRQAWRRWTPSGGRTQEPPAHRAALLLLALSTFWSCLHGALAFPSFEGRDGWGHALGARYLLETGVPRQPLPEWPLVHYVDAYPPLFDVLLSLASAWGGAVNAPIKAVSAMAAALAVPAFYFLVLRLVQSPRVAAVASALYAALPGNLTRHVWAHSLALVFLFVALHAAVRLRESSDWLIPGSMVTAGLMLTAPTTAIKGLALLLLLGVACGRTARVWSRRVFAQALLASLLAAVWYVPAFVRYGWELRRAMESPQARRDRMAGDTSAAPHAPHRGGSAASRPRPYGPDDFFFFRPYSFGGLLTEPKQAEEIAPAGVGLPLAVLSLWFLLLGPRAAFQEGRGVSASIGSRALRLWLAAILVLALAPHVRLDFYAWRSWLVLCPLACAAAAAVLCRAVRGSSAASCVAVAALALAGVINAGGAVVWDFLGSIPSRAFWSHGRAAGPENPGFFLLGNPAFGLVLLGAALLGWGALTGGRGRSRGLRMVGAVIVAAHVVIAGPVRLRTLTRYIPPMGYASDLEYRGYLFTVTSTRVGDRVLPLSGGARSAFLIGLDRSCRPWERREHEVMRAAASPRPELTPAMLVAWLRAAGYQYLVMDPSYLRQLAEGGLDAAERRRRVAAVANEPGLAPVLRVQPEAGAEDETFMLLRVLSSAATDGGQAN
jgi:hypothetical protein